jgi:hypothetical protein
MFSQCRSGRSALREPHASERDAERAAPDDDGPQPLGVERARDVVLLVAVVALERAQVDDVAGFVPAPPVTR